MDTIRNPIEWGMDKLKEAGVAMESAGGSIQGTEADRAALHPAVRRIGVAELQRQTRPRPNVGPFPCQPGMAIRLDTVAFAAALDHRWDRELDRRDTRF